MKPIILIIAITLISAVSFGQSVQKAPTWDNVVSKSYPIDGTPLLQKQYQQAAEFMRAHPNFAEEVKLQKTTAWNFSVGATHNWWTVRPNDGTYYQDASTCRKVGTHCYIFVEDSLWNVRVNQAAVDSIENDFDNKTPANPDKGIYTMDVGAFGNPPNVDSDSMIIILICNIQDGYTGTGGYVAGFFDPAQEIPGTNSNQGEMYYVDANPTDLRTADGIESAMSTAAHEFQHMINYKYHTGAPGSPLEPTFINEGCSMLAEINCGYPPTDLSLYANETNHYLFDWRIDDNTLVLNDYSRAQRFNLYLWDRYGIGLFKFIVQSTMTSGASIINNAFANYGVPITFNALFTNWLIANEVNDTTSNRLYGYAYKNLPVSSGRTYYNPNVTATDTVQRVGARYLLFKGGSNLSVTFSNPSSSSNISVEAIEIGSGTPNVVSVPFGSPFAVPDFGSTYNTVAFAVINTDPSLSIPYSYQASGAAPTASAELKWDDTEPTGYYVWATSDTLCVTFDAYPGGTLDSIRVALRRAGSMIGGIYEYSGVQQPSPLGRLLLRDTLSTTDSLTLTPQNTYPVPYPNWATVNLSSHNISTDQPFAVAFVIGSTPKAPGVMATDFTSQSPYHSYTYLSASESSPSPAGWYFISSSNTTIAIYVIRAYVRFTTGVTQEVSPVPLEFKLGQNYPNPFNPSTVIAYQLSKASQVSLKVYDILGREVAELVNKRQELGHYSVNFDASALPSGVFFYRLTTGGNTEVKKMVFMK